MAAWYTHHNRAIDHLLVLIDQCNAAHAYNVDDKALFMMHCNATLLGIINTMKHLKEIVHSVARPLYHE